jgi:hypothetical protein
MNFVNVCWFWRTVSLAYQAEAVVQRATWLAAGIAKRRIIKLLSEQSPVLKAQLAE